MLPRSIANFEAFENAMSLDICMGGSTNTILHLLAAAEEGEIPFTLDDIDRLSRTVPHLCKVAPSPRSSTWRTCTARAACSASSASSTVRGMLHGDSPTVHSPSMAAAIETWDITRTADEEVKTNSTSPVPAACPLRPPSARAGSGTRWTTTAPKRLHSRSGDNAYSKDGGLAVLYGNIALDGCVVKTAGVDESIHVFSGPARIVESQDDGGGGDPGQGGSTRATSC